VVPDRWQPLVSQLPAYMPDHVDQWIEPVLSKPLHEQPFASVQTVHQYTTPVKQSYATMALHVVRIHISDNSI